MQFLITHVDFDVDNDDLTSEELALDYVGEIWEADDEDDLIDEITNDAEYCIKSIDYRHILKWKLTLKPILCDSTMSSLWCKFPALCLPNQRHIRASKHKTTVC